MFEQLLLHFSFLAVAVGLLVAATVLYVVITPYRELELIRAGNAAASYSLGGTIVGFSLAIYSVAANTLSLGEMAMWGAIALLSQLCVFLLVRVFLPDLTQKIEAGEVSYGLILGSASIAMGAINAGVLVY